MQTSTVNHYFAPGHTQALCGIPRVPTNEPAIDEEKVTCPFCKDKLKFVNNTAIQLALATEVILTGLYCTEKSGLKDMAVIPMCRGTRMPVDLFRKLVADPDSPFWGRVSINPETDRVSLTDEGRTTAKKMLEQRGFLMPDGTVDPVLQGVSDAYTQFNDTIQGILKEAQQRRK